jgi:hypothetical protein
MSATYADALTALYPNESWSMTDDLNYVTLVWNSTVVAKPTQEVLDAERVTLDQQAPYVACKQEASRRLYLTDWTTIADVADPTKSDPYLTNQAAFVAYRSNLRKLAVNPEVNPVWPVEPTAAWSA